MYKEIKEEDLIKDGETILLIVTATDLETDILHSKLVPIREENSLLKAHHEERTYYKGLFGEYCCIHIQCDTMGSIGVASSIITVREAIRLVNPKAVIMIGIAFGIDEKEQKIGDVLVANYIVPYDFKKIAAGQSVVRAQATPSSSLLINKFKNARGWEFRLENGKSNKIIAPVFSGEELINCLDRRNELSSFNPQAKGGEMEGAGLYTAANGHAHWILIKGICDFADGNKDIDKDKNQVVAMLAATSLCLEVFSSTEAFKSIGLYPSQKTLEIPTITPSLVNEVVFDIYNTKKEIYYLQREIDSLIISCLKFQSIWVYGKSGRGKSIALLRNILQSDFKSISVSLANCIGFGIDNFFNEIYIELTAYLEPDCKITEQLNHQEAVRRINMLLEKHFLNDTIYILIDEIPLGNDDNFKTFTKRLFSLFITSSLSNKNVSIKYVLSSIYSPEENIESYQQQIKSLIRFVEFDDWSTEELTKLLTLIQNKLNISLEHSVIQQLIILSKGSPRWIKKFLKNLFILGEINSSNIENAILQTNYEITI